MTFTKSSLNKMRAELDAVLAKYGESAGVKFSIGNMRFTENKCDIKLQALSVTEGGQVTDPYEEDFKLRCARYGLSREHLGVDIRVRDKDLKIVGLNSKKRTCPILVLNKEDNKKYLIPASEIRNALGIKDLGFYRG
jgi:hypothetical protein